MPAVTLWDVDGFAGTGDLRASDDDREKQAEVVRQAAAEGRLDFTELEERLERVYAARTYAELAEITRDLPNAELVVPSPPAGAKVDRAGRQSVQALFSTQKIKGAWTVPRRMSVRSIAGTVVLDFTETSMPHEVVVDVQVIVGELSLIVPEDVAVELEPQLNTVLGEVRSKVTTERAPGVPVIRVRGSVFLGELTAKPPSGFKKWLRRDRWS